MRNYLIILNGTAIADYFRLGNAKRRFKELSKKYDPELNDLTLVDINTGELIDCHRV